jgi:hypothetical protein
MITSLQPLACICLPLETSDIRQCSITFIFYNFNNITYLCQSTIKACLHVLFVRKSSFQRMKLTDISEAHSNEKTHVME